MSDTLNPAWFCLPLQRCQSGMEINKGILHEVTIKHAVVVFHKAVVFHQLFFQWDFKKPFLIV